jgi:hypothetical protein
VLTIDLLWITGVKDYQILSGNGIKHT